MPNELVCLKIPSGWAVIHNNFGDEDPIVENGTIVNEEYYSEDLLSIEKLRFNQTHWITDKQGYLIDLGWYPQADPEGSYRLTLLQGDWDNIIFEYESTNRHEIKLAIETCLDSIAYADDEKSIKTRINRRVELYRQSKTHQKNKKLRVNPFFNKTKAENRD